MHSQHCATASCMQHSSREVQPYLNSKRLEVHLVAEVTNSSAGSKESFGRHTAPVHTGATDIMSLDDSNLHALFYCMQRCSVPANTTSDDNKVIVVAPSVA